LQTDCASAKQGDLFGAVIMLQALQEFTQFTWWMQTKCQVAANI